MPFFPVDAHYQITDGTAAPVAGDLRDFSDLHRSGMEITANNEVYQRGRTNRAAGENGRLRYVMNSISPGVVEADSRATTGTTVLFPINDTRYQHERMFRRTFTPTQFWTINCNSGGVTPDSPDNDVLLLNVALMATGTVTVMGF